ncbi:MAG: hypothetical protein ABIQ88_14500 [Chitinophagaceae bacterium]
MTDLNQPNDPFIPPTEKPVLPSGLNVLTILTFIGCGLAFLSGCWNFFNAKNGIDKMEEMINSGKLDEMPAFARKMFSPEMLELSRKAYENRLPIFLLTLVSVALCLVGAMQMRKLKAQGYFLYVIGEVLPLIGILLFMGTAALTGMMGGISIGIVALFVILYTMQRKYLINK